GFQDLVVTALQDDQIRVLINDQMRDFNDFGNSNCVYNVGVEPNAVAVGDFDENGALDIFVGNRVGAGSMLYGNGDGTFSQAVAMGGGSEDVDIADFDSDGDLDLLSTFDAGTLQVRYGDGSGLFNGVSNIVS